ncbi:MAG: Ig-like domain-containing protein, partial [Cellvibrionales bacterium]|nr:Ig-like domain-containing protein [Cellvibrionales bacterium]
MFDTLLDLRFLKPHRKLTKLNKYLCLSMVGFASLPGFSESSAIEWQTASLPDANEGGFMNARLIATKGAKAESHSLTYHIEQAPSWVKMTERGIMTYQPDFTMAGRYKVSVSATDGSEKAIKTFNLFVKDVNQLPILQEIAPVSVKEGEQLSIQAETSDLDNDAITLKLKQAPGGMRLENGQIIWTPSATSSGEHIIELLASDGKDKVSQTFAVTVIDVNQPPRWKKGFSLPRAKENKPYRVVLPVTDIDGDALTIVYQGTNQSIQITGNTLSYQPNYDAAGKYALDILVFDGQSQVKKTFDLVVQNTNRKPLWITENLPYAKEGTAFSLQLDAKDADAQPLSYKVIDSPGDLSVSTTGKISWQPDYESAGDHVVSIHVSDGEAEVVKNWVLSVENTNRAPVFTSQSLANAKENNRYRVDIPAQDPDGQLLTYALVTGPEGLWLENDQIHWLPDYDAAGEHTMTILASDGELSTEQAFTLTVENTNRLPEIDSEPVVNVAEGAQYQYPLSFYDKDGDTLVAKLVKSPKGMRLIGNEILWQPDYESAGSVDVEVIVAESSNAKAKAVQRFVIDVANTNRLPVFSPLNLTKAKEDKPLTFTLKAADADKQPLSFSAVDVPLGMTVNSEGVVNWQPSFEQSGDYNLVFSVDDTDDQVTYALPLFVENTNRSPSLVTELLVDAKEAMPWEMLLEGDDPDGDLLSYQLIRGPEGLALEGETLIWQPSFEQSGAHQVVVEVTDGDLKAKKNYSLVVENTNRAPEWPTLSNAALSLKENKPWALRLASTDADLQSL